MLILIERTFAAMATRIPMFSLLAQSSCSWRGGKPPWSVIGDCSDCLVGSMTVQPLPVVYSGCVRIQDGGLKTWVCFVARNPPASRNSPYSDNTDIPVTPKCVKRQAQLGLSIAAQGVCFRFPWMPARCFSWFSKKFYAHARSYCIWSRFYPSMLLYHNITHAH